MKSARLAAGDVKVSAGQAQNRQRQLLELRSSDVAFVCQSRDCAGGTNAL